MEQKKTKTEKAALKVYQLFAYLRCCQQLDAVQTDSGDVALAFDELKKMSSDFKKYPTKWPEKVTFKNFESFNKEFAMGEEEVLEAKPKVHQVCLLLGWGNVASKHKKTV